VPVPPLSKAAGQACQFQKFRKGCTVYNSARMPIECSLWNCRWLVNDDAAELSRPDRAHYVIDIAPDFITNVFDTGERMNIEVVQIWIDPKHPNAHRDPALRRWIFRRAERGIAALIRFNQRDGLVLVAPPPDAGGEGHEITSDFRPGPSHSMAEIEKALGGRVSITVEKCAYG
jgi:hypothetical protein